jgi:hypothetical protein
MMSDARYIGTVTMTTEAWSQIADNPKQRNTEKHAEVAKKGHLKTPHEAHMFVEMAIDETTGKEYKIDGHTRSFLWSRGELKAPETLEVRRYSCPDLKAIGNLYNTADNKNAVKTNLDEVEGTLKSLKVALKSNFMRDLKFQHAMREAYKLAFGPTEAKMASIEDLVRFWKDEILELDALDVLRRYFPVGVVAAFFLTVKKERNLAIGFWTRYAQRSGVQTGTEMDPVLALHARIDNLRISKKLTRTGDAMQVILTVLGAYEKDKKKGTYRDDTALRRREAGGLVKWLKDLGK